MSESPEEKPMRMICALVAAGLLFPALSFATDWDVVAHVTQIEPSYVPNNIIFAIDKNAGTCAAGPWLFYYGDAASSNIPQENIKAVYAALLSALQTGTAIEVYGNSSGCKVVNIHFLNHS